MPFKGQNFDLVTGEELIPHNGNDYILTDNHIELNKNESYGSYFNTPDVLKGEVYSISCQMDIIELYTSKGVGLTGHDNDGFVLGFGSRSVITIGRIDYSPVVETPSGFLQYYFERNGNEVRGMVLDSSGNILSYVNSNIIPVVSDYISISDSLGDGSPYLPDNVENSHLFLKNLRIFDKPLTSEEIYKLSQEV
jgi:hypothetical protein